MDEKIGTIVAWTGIVIAVHGFIIGILFPIGVVIALTALAFLWDKAMRRIYQGG